MSQLPTSAPVLDPAGLMSLSWRSYFDQRDRPVSPNSAQVVAAGGKINITTNPLQIILLDPAAPVTTGLIAFEGSARDGARIILVCLQNSVTIKDNDVDGGCALGADFVLNAKRSVSFIYIAELKRFLRL